MGVVFDEEAFRQILDEMIPFSKFLSMKLVEATPGEVEMMIPFREELIGDIRRPAIHGGVISSLFDTVGGAAAMTTLTSFEDKLSTIDLRIDYLLPGEAKDLYARGTILRSGNRIVVTKMWAYQEDRKRVIAEGRAVFNVRRKGE